MNIREHEIIGIFLFFLMLETKKDRHEYMTLYTMYFSYQGIYKIITTSSTKRKMHELFLPASGSLEHKKWCTYYYYHYHYYFECYCKSLYLKKYSERGLVYLF